MTYFCEAAVGGKPGRLIVQTGPECPYRVGDAVQLVSRGRAVALEGSEARAPQPA